MTETRKKFLLFISSFFLIFFLLFFFSTVPNLTLFSIKSLDDSQLISNEIEIPEIIDGDEINFNGYKYSNSSGIIISTEPKINCQWKNPDNDDGWKTCEAIFEIDNLGKNHLEFKNPNIELKFEKPDEVKNLEITYSDEYALTYEEEENTEVKEQKFSKFYSQSDNNNENNLKRNIVENKNKKFKKRNFYNFGKFEFLNKDISIKNNETLDIALIENETIENNSSLDNSSLDNSSLDNSSLDNSSLDNSSLDNSSLDNSSLDNSSYDNYTASNNNPNNNELNDSFNENEMVNNNYQTNMTETSSIIESKNNSESERTYPANDTINNDHQEFDNSISDSEVIENSDIILNEINTEESIQEIVQTDEDNLPVEEMANNENNNEFNSEESPRESRSLISGLVIDLLETENQVNIPPIAVMVNFEIPKYSSNSFDFIISEGEILAKIDPEASICGDLAVENSVYILDRDFVSADTCFTISADNITLDCQGHFISHSLDDPGYGVYSSFSKTIIKNCNIFNGDNNINPSRNLFLSESTDSEIYNNTLNISGIGNFNIYIEGGENNKVYNNNLIIDGENTYGLFADYTTINFSYNNITSYSNNDYALYFNQIYDSSIENNHFWINGSLSFPVIFQTSLSTKFYNNSLISLGNNIYSLYLDSSLSINISNNNITSYGENSYNIYIVNFTNDSILEYNHLSLINAVSESCSVFMADSNNNYLNNNQINTASDNSEGLCLMQLENVQIINNQISSYIDAINLNNIQQASINDNNLTVLGFQGSGIYSSACSNITINNNDIYPYNNNQYGLFFEYLTNSSVNSNNLNTFYPNSYSLYLTTESNSNVISGNNILSRGIQSYGVSLSASSQINFSNNNLVCTSIDGKCIYLSELYSSDIINNSVFISNETPYGLYINTDSSNNRFEYNNIFSEVPNSVSSILKSSTNNSFFLNNLTNTGNSGVSLFITSNPGENYFNSNIINSSGIDSNSIYFEFLNEFIFMQNDLFITSGISDYPFYIYSSDNNFIIKDSIFRSGSEVELYIEDNILSGQWDFINTSFYNITWNLNSYAILNNSNYINVFINNSLGEPVNNVEVILKDRNDELISNKTSDINGAVNFIASSYIKNSSENIDYLSNYTLNIIYNNLIFNLTINLSRNQDVYYNLDTSESEILFLGGSGNNLRQVNLINNRKSINIPTPVLPPPNLKPKKVTLFDISLRLLNKEINFGKKISGVIGLINVALPGRVNANLYYRITDMNDNIYIEEDEIVPVETQTEFIKEFDTSKLNEGEYKIFVKLDYLGQTEPAEAQETFIIKKGIGEKVANILQGKLIYTGFLSLILSLIMTILLHFYELRIKFKKN